ncbi:HEPN domain-containing protein [Chitinophaga dinghuensis]|uniref:HEPN domain-containing protein n=1 Tax=Chitinophaga dinghuensis TaxID=1539050 RepID=A0A327VVT7_9BACT|nr:HEPN domain-containing protein [Chitinophaga dinghuensis]RAJ80111.1 HEPN domain-containing protein [Chitinophaga dinghuensis]
MLNKHDLQPAWMNRTFTLSLPEVQNPFEVLQNFFLLDDLYGLRESLWEIIKSTVTGSFNKELDRNTRGDMVFFYENLERLIEASYLLHKLWKDKKLQWPIMKEKEEEAEIVCEEESDRLDDNPIIYGVIDSGSSIPAIDKVFLVKYHSRTDYAASLLYLTHNNEMSHVDLEKEIQKHFSDDLPVNISIRPATEVYNALREGHLFYERVCRQERIKYNAHNTVLPKKHYIPAEIVQQKAQDNFGKIFTLVSNFREGATYYRRSNNAALAAFSLHQAAEHSLRALLISVMGTAPHTHNLNKLIKTSLFLTEDIGKVFNESDTRDNLLLLLLNQAYKKSRYNFPDEYSISDTDLNTLFDKISTLENVVKGSFAEIVSQFGQLPYCAYRTISTIN